MAIFGYPYPCLVTRLPVFGSRCCSASCCVILLFFAPVHPTRCHVTLRQVRCHFQTSQECLFGVFFDAAF